MVTDYMIAIGEDIKSLQQAVREKLAEGWEPTGGLMQGGTDNTYPGWLLQALVWHGENAPPES